MLVKGQASKILIAATAGVDCRQFQGELATSKAMSLGLYKQSLTTQQVASLHLFSVAAKSSPLSLPALKDGVSRRGTDGAWPKTKTSSLP
jgi:hypothetical protein